MIYHVRIDNRKRGEKMNRGTERRLLRQELDLLAEESKHPYSSSDIARLAEAMCHIHDRLVRNRIRVLMLAIIVIMLAYLSVSIVVKIQ